MAEYDVYLSEPFSPEPGTNGEWHRVFLDVERDGLEATFGVHNWYLDDSGDEYVVEVSDERYGEGPDYYIFYPDRGLLVVDGVKIEIPMQVSKKFLRMMEKNGLPEGGV
jgi:hypothetical protein